MGSSDYDFVAFYTRLSVTCGDAWLIDDIWIHRQVLESSLIFLSRLMVSACLSFPSLCFVSIFCSSSFFWIFLSRDSLLLTLLDTRVTMMGGILSSNIAEKGDLHEFCTWLSFSVVCIPVHRIFDALCSLNYSECRVGVQCRQGLLEKLSSQYQES